ncbi:MAG: winged helix-turn-helix transcriptional regulator [Solobacterium sp.]|nr:winged helix-turn-helix transcriptional regulator [Solobacterium sp.]
MKENGYLKAKEIAKALNLSLRQVQRILARLKKEGRLVRHGASKNGYWEVEEI